MKKIIVAMALVVSAVAIQAAQVSWSITNVQDSPSASVAEGWIVQLFASDVVYSYDLAKAGTITATASAYTVENTSTGFMNVSGAKFGDFAAGESYSYYAVIYDATTIDGAKNYFVTSVKSGSISANGSDKSLSFGNMTSTSTTSAFYGNSWQAVPEPTSGLLLMLGVAGLALKRKRA